MSEFSLSNLIKILFLSTLPLFAENVLMYSLPKTGTNLVLKLLKTLVGETEFHNIGEITRTIYWGHEWKIGSEVFCTIGPSTEKIEALKRLDTKIILLLRDPRQHIIALLRSIKKPINRITINWAIKNFPLLLKLQTGSTSFLKYRNINECYEDYLNWASRYPDVYITSFEKLVGPKGGGTTAAQVQEISNIMQFLGKNITESQATIIASNLFGGTHTFKVGKIDSWKKYYSQENRAEFKKIAGRLLIQLGYEKDDNW